MLRIKPTFPPPEIELDDPCNLFIFPVLLLIAYCTRVILRRTPAYKKDSNFNKWVMAVSLILAGLLFIRYGTSFTLIKGLLMLLIYIYAGICDIESRHVRDSVHIMLFIVGLVDINFFELCFNSVTAVAALIFMLICAVISKNKVGGADVKFIPASIFILGLYRGIAGLIAGLILCVAGTLIRNKVTKSEDRTLPMIPYLAIGFFAMYFI